MTSLRQNGGPCPPYIMTAVATESHRPFNPDRWIIAGGMAVLTGVSWAYLFWDAHRMSLEDCCVPMTGAWGLGDLFMLSVMWTIMMIAMMVPTAAPMVMMFARIQQQRRQNDRPFVPTALFLLGYVLVWTAFSLAATAAQWGLHAASLMSPGMASTSAIFGGAVLLATGIFQFTPLKRSCLGHCRSPMQFLMADWREGRTGAIGMGLKHGLICTGCCWLLMIVLFVVGVMNLLWVAIITAFVLAEKVIPGGQRLAAVAGVALVGWGAWILARAIV